MRVAVLGAGYAGVAAARRLERKLPDRADLVVVDETGYHLLTHELHRIVRYPSLAGTVRIPLDEILGESTATRQARVQHVDPDAGVATFESGELSYDLGVVCLGTVPDFSDAPGVRAHAIPLKTLSDAGRIREDFLDVLPDARVVVGGAGLSGIQVAGELAAFASERDVRANICLIEQRNCVAPGFPPRFQDAVREELQARGVAVHTGAVVRGADADAVDVDRTAGEDADTDCSPVNQGGGRSSGDQGGSRSSGEHTERLQYDLFVWTGGIRGPAALGGNRPAVPSTLRLGDRTFAVGDAARVIDADGEVVPASAQAAVREAQVAASNVEALVEHELEGGTMEPRLQRFRFDALGWVVSVGDGAVAKIGPAVLRGRAARAAKAAVDASYLGGLGATRNAASLVREELGW